MFLEHLTHTSLYPEKTHLFIKLGSDGIFSGVCHLCGIWAIICSCFPMKRCAMVRHTSGPVLHFHFPMISLKHNSGNSAVKWRKPPWDLNDTSTIKITVPIWKTGAFSLFLFLKYGLDSVKEHIAKTLTKKINHSEGRKKRRRRDRERRHITIWIQSVPLKGSYVKSTDSG